MGDFFLTIRDGLFMFKIKRKKKSHENKSIKF